MQTAQLVSVAEESCWEFVSTQMAPLSLETNPSCGITSDYDPKEVIDKFIKAISRLISTLSKTEV